MDRQISRPWIASPNGLITMLIAATIAPALLGPPGVVLTFGLAFVAVLIAYLRPELDRRWYVLALLPTIAYGSVIVAVLFFGR